MDCKNILIKTNRDIRSLNYELMSIVPSKHDEAVNVIMGRKPFDIEVL